MKKGTRQKGVGKIVVRRSVRMVVAPRVTPSKKARSEMPDSDFEPFG